MNRRRPKSADGNSRSGSYPKTVATDVGPLEVQMPLQSDLSFEPVTRPQATPDGPTAQMIPLYSKGMTIGRHPGATCRRELQRPRMHRTTEKDDQGGRAWRPPS